MEFRFSKYTGAGNDFVIAAASEAGDTPLDRLARRVCSRATGVGVDGLVLVERLADDRLAVRFFNPDGSEFSTCGNGTRCAARYALDESLVMSEPFTVVTSAAEIRARSTTDGIALDYRIAARVTGPYRASWQQGERRGWLIWMGLPHVVLSVESLPDGAIDELCRPIRHDPSLGPDGANVNLVALTDRRSGAIRTFERGVEGETLACGSGAMASVLALHAAGLCDASVTLSTRGGDALSVALGPGADGSGAGGLAEIRLAGPARRLFSGLFQEPGR